MKCREKIKSKNIPSKEKLIEALKNFQNTKRHIIIGGIYKSNNFDKVKFLSSDEIYIYGINKNEINNIIKKGKSIC